MRLLPPHGISGKWVLREPFFAKPAITYTCVAIRSFIEIELKGQSVYEMVYQPHELTERDHQNDAGENATIVTLLANTGEVIHVPDTYIVSYPVLGADDYRRFILSCDLGALPKNTSFHYLTSLIRQEVGRYVGREPNVEVHIGDMSLKLLTSLEQLRIENNQKQVTDNNVTLAGRFQNLNIRVGEMQAYIALLEKQLADGTSIAETQAAEELKLKDQQISILQTENEALRNQVQQLEAQLNTSG